MQTIGEIHFGKKSYKMAKEKDEHFGFFKKSNQPTTTK